MCPVNNHLPCTYPDVVPGRYLVSDAGQIWDLERHWYLKTHIDRYGYVCLDILSVSRQDYMFCRMHRLVAWEFVPFNRDYNLDVNHIDGNKQNNFASNLEWVSRHDNNVHAIVNGLRPTKLTVEDVHNICQLLQDSVMSYNEIIYDLDLEDRCDADRINEIKRRKTWKHISDNYDFTMRGEDH